MAGQGVSAFLVTRRTDAFYLTGFTGEDSAILVLPRAVHVISDARFEETISDEIPWARKHLRKNLLADEIGKVCRSLDLKELYVQPSGLTVSDHAALRKAVRPTKLVAAPAICKSLRICKDETEIKALGRAIRVAQKAFQAVCSQLRVGMTERELAARIEYEMRLLGAEGASFDTIVAIDANASHPHAHAGSRRIRSGSSVLIDWGAVVGWYRSDLTRCIFVNKIPPRIGKVYDVVLEAQLAAIRAVKPGARMCDVDDVARGVIRKAGFGDRFGHGLGHGLGLEVHEPPSLSWRSAEKLAAGMVVTVEPGIYLPGVGGVRIEDDVLVVPGGCRVLSHLPKQLGRSVVRV